MTLMLAIADNDQATSLAKLRLVLKKADQLNVDYIVSVGDLGKTVYDNPKVLEETSKRIIAIPGNHDPHELRDQWTMMNHVTDVHARCDKEFFGWGESVERPGEFGDSVKIHTGDILLEEFEKLIDTAKQKGANKLLMHKPPYNLVDFAALHDESGMFWGGDFLDKKVSILHRGHHSAKRILDLKLGNDPSILGIFGHFHYPGVTYDANGILKTGDYSKYTGAMRWNGSPVAVGETVKNLAVNPGPVGDGMYALIEELQNKRFKYIGHGRV